MLDVIVITFVLVLYFIGLWLFLWVVSAFKRSLTQNLYDVISKANNDTKNHPRKRTYKR